MKEFPKENTLHSIHSTTIDGLEYDVYKLIQYGNNIKPIQLEIRELNRELDYDCWKDIEGNKFSPRSLLQEFEDLGSWDEVGKIHPEWQKHIEQVKNADYSYPILLYKYDLIDGMHRLLKAYTEKRNDIYARIIGELPKEASITL